MASEHADVLDDGAASAALIEQIRVERERLHRERFQGQDPAVRGPGGKAALATVARLVAADREGALIHAGGRALNPSEDRAEDALAAAIGALPGCVFDTVSRELATASRFARDPVRQQRATAIRALANMVRAVVFTLPGERLRGEPQALKRLLPTLDRLDDDERSHYQTEADGLHQAWREAADNARLWRRWALLRARLALRAGGDESAIAWALRAWDREQPRPFVPDVQVSTLVSTARRVFEPLLAPEDDVPDEFEPPRARDVVQAISAAIQDHDGDAHAETRDPFAVMPYHPPTVSGDQERPA